VDIWVAVFVIPVHIITELVVLGSLLNIRGWVIRSRSRGVIRSRSRVIRGRSRVIRGRSWMIRSRGRVIRGRRGIGVTSKGHGRKGTD